MVRLTIAFLFHPSQSTAASSLKTTTHNTISSPHLLCSAPFIPASINDSLYSKTVIPLWPVVFCTGLATVTSSPARRLPRLAWCDQFHRKPCTREMFFRVSRRGFSSVTPRPWLFVGLGNPGDKYKGTRHNVGFEMIDAFANDVRLSMDTEHCKAILGKGFVNDFPVFLAKPQTYMNLSGESIGPLAAYYKLPLNRVLVIHDDMNLPCGVLRLHHNGSQGNHNGLKSVIHHFRGNKEFPRLRIGIGRPPGQMDPKAFLLQKFNATARERIDSALEEGVGGLKQVLSQGLTESARCFNTEQKYKHIRLQTLPT